MSDQTGQNIVWDPSRLRDLEFFSDLDFHFARTLCRIVDEQDDLVVFSCALLSRMLAEGHVCIDIRYLGGKTLDIPGHDALIVKLPDSGTWLERLSGSRLVSSEVTTPLVLDASGNLYLAKYYDFQQRLVNNLIRRLTGPDEGCAAENLTQEDLKMIPEAVMKVETQKKAVLSAVLKKMTIISGGPGTGKTFVARAIKTAFGRDFFRRFNREPVILSLAPTGKAASKMDQGRTIHSILKPLADRPGFRFNKDNQLKADAVIIDEASMIDLLLLARLMEAIPFETHVILMGDRHQLASVQAGSVFSDICGSEGLSGHIHELNHNFRSGEKSHIHQLAGAIRNNQFNTVKHILSKNDLPDVAFYPLQPGETMEFQLSSLVMAGYGAMQLEPDPERALDGIDAFKILCAHNSGEYGTLQINHLCENILRHQGNSGIQKGLFKKVVMVNVNDYDKDLFNGDTGIVSASDENQVFLIRKPDGKMRMIKYAQLPAHETAFAITVHKAQGSEFNQVLLIVPERISPVLTRRLLYTGVTRARNRLIIMGRMDLIKNAMDQDMERSSGIGRMINRGLDTERKTA